MEVNREWYNGNTATVTDGAATPKLIYEYLTDTMYSKILAETTDKYLGEWDKSVCPWKISYQADFINPDYILAWTDGSSWHVDRSPLYKERKKGYTFYLSANGDNMNDRYDLDTYGANFCTNWPATLTRSDYDITETATKEWTESKYDRTNVIVNFNYSKIFVVPTVNGNPLNPNIETNFDPTSIYSLGFAFYTKNLYDFGVPASMGAVSLNNKQELPEWSEWCTNCYKEEDMIDNGLFITPYYVEHTNLHPLPSMGTRATWVAIPWRNRTTQFIQGGTGTGFSTRTWATQAAAATINYFYSKAIYISTGRDSIYDEYEAYYEGGTTGDFQESVRRHLKSTVTYADLVDYLATQCAYLGFRFCLDVTKINESVNSQYFYIPEIDDLGVTTGNYYQANTAEAQLQQNYTWTDDVFEKTPYDGTNDDEEGDPNTYTETTDWNDFTQSPTLSFTDMYILDELSIAGLATKFYESLSLKPSTQLVTEYFSETYLTTEPTDVIVSLRYYYIPLDSKVSHSSATEEILLGTYHTGVSGYNVTCTTARYDYGEHLYYPHFGDFRDYAPYSTAILIIPYCGTVSIDPQEFMGHYVRVQMVIDYATGTCTAYIMKDELVVNSISGQIGIEIPVTAIAGQDLQRNLFNGYQNLKAAKLQSAQSMAQGAMSFLGSAMSSNPLGMAQSVMSTIFGEERSEIGIEAAEYNLQHTQVPFRQVGSINPGAAVRQEQQCRLIIFRPVMDPNYDPVEYGHVTGFATLETGLLSEYTGFTQCSNVILDSLPCTIEEKQSIERLLQSGVYL